MPAILLALWPVIALILLGHLIQRFHLLAQDFWASAEKLNYFCLFPALLVINLAQAPLNNPDLPKLAAIILGGLGAGYLFLWLIKLKFNWPASYFGVWVQGGLRFNTYLGMALVSSLYGSEGLALAALILAIKIPTLNFLSVWALLENKRANWRRLVQALIKNPLILGAIVGILLNYSGIGLPLGSANLLQLLGAASLPLGLLCVGAALQPTGFFKHSSKVLAISLLKLIALPIALGMLALALGLSNLLVGLLVIFFALPTAPSAYILTRLLGGDAQLMAALITLQTLLAALSLPLALQALAIWL